MGLLDKLFKRKEKASVQTDTQTQPNTSSTINNNPTTNSSDAVVVRGLVTTHKIAIDNSILSELNAKFIAFDVETTGLSPANDRIIEVGAVLFENGEPKDQYGSLINIHNSIPASASAVNHITNDMIASAPDEDVVYRNLVSFLGTALNEQIIICAHNAKFDMDFLSESLMRMGYSGKVLYVDTLGLSRQLINGLSNYKQNTVAAYFGIINSQAHRAVSDALVCGKILFMLMKLKQEDNQKRLVALESSKPNDEEREVCAFIQKIILDNGGDIEYLGFYKNSSNYVDVQYMYTVLKFKVAKKGKYIIMEKEAVPSSDLPIEQCTMSEGGSSFVRVYFNYPSDLKSLSSHIYKKYHECRKNAHDYLRYNSKYRDELLESPALSNAISLDEMAVLLETAERRMDNPNKEMVVPAVQSLVNRADIKINPIHSRVPLSEIKNLHNWNKGFDEGYSYWEKGDSLRKEGKLYEALQLFDKARYYGYFAPVLYESYAMAFHKLKDYENEIDILDEGIKRQKSHKGDISRLEARRSKAIQALIKQRQEIELQNEKQKKKEKSKAEKESRQNSELKTSSGRRILKMNDDHVLIQAYESIADASRDTGISPKSIRDAAKGVQKHAGGFVWKYADE